MSARLWATEDLIKMLSGQVWGWSKEGVELKHVEELNINRDDRRLRLALDLAHQLIGTPRHLSQHPGGFVLARDRLDDLVPIEPAAMKDRQVIEWDKDPYRKSERQSANHKKRQCERPTRQYASSSATRDLGL